MAILGFADKETEKVFIGNFSRRLPRDIQRMAYRKMLYMDSVDTLNDLRSPPSKQLEPLFGDRVGQYSIRINRQYRLCFRVSDTGFTDVEIVDYH